LKLLKPKFQSFFGTNLPSKSADILHESLDKETHVECNPATSRWRRVIRTFTHRCKYPLTSHRKLKSLIEEKLKNGLKDGSLDEEFKTKMLTYVNLASKTAKLAFPDDAPTTLASAIEEVKENIRKEQAEEEKEKGKKRNAQEKKTEGDAAAAAEKGGAEEEELKKMEREKKKREREKEEAKRKRQKDEQGRKKEVARTSASSSSAKSAPSASEKGKRKSRDEDAGSQCIDLLRAFLGPILSRPGSLVSLEFFLLLSCGCMRFIFVCLIMLL
jgi:hypothetical protein